MKHNVPTEYLVPYMVDSKGIVDVARARQYSPERLAQCFTDMPRYVAEQLLLGELEITSEGRTYAPTHTRTP
jgi:hypothetical protein